MSMAMLIKWFSRSMALLVGIALIVVAIGLSIGKIGSLSIHIQHPVPDFVFEIRAPEPKADTRPNTSPKNPASKIPPIHSKTRANQMAAYSTPGYSEKAPIQAADVLR
jgi:hypothetical protein